MTGTFATVLTERVWNWEGMRCLIIFGLLKYLGKCLALDLVCTQSYWIAVFWGASGC